jgi:hypothetical protein
VSGLLLRSIPFLKVADSLFVAFDSMEQASRTDGNILNQQCKVAHILREDFDAQSQSLVPFG